MFGQTVIFAYGTIAIRMSKIVENFYKNLFGPKLMTMLNGKIPNVPEKDSFSVSARHFELKRQLRKITGRWEKARYGILNKIMSSLVCGYIFQVSGEKDFSDLSKVC